MSTANTRILIVDDEEIVRESLGGWLEKDGYTVGTAPDGPTAVARLRQELWSILLVDMKMPGMDGLQVLDESLKLQPDARRGDHDRLCHGRNSGERHQAGGLRLPREAVRSRGAEPDDPEDRQAAGARARERDAAQGVAPGLPLQGHGEQERADAGRVRAGARRPRRAPSTILILGESGTGKELLARAIHAESPRAVQPFVAVSLRRAHRDAARERAVRPREGRVHRRRRRAARAVRGGATAARSSSTRSATSARSCRSSSCACSRTRQFRRVGGNDADHRRRARSSPRPTATCSRRSTDGQFREDLFYRLNVVPISCRRCASGAEDIPLLVEHFLERMSAELGKPRRWRVARRRWRMLMSLRLAGQRARAAQPARAGDGVRGGADPAGERLRPRRGNCRGTRSGAGIARGRGAAPHRRHPGTVRRQRDARRARAGHRPRDALQQDPQVPGCASRRDARFDR